MNRNPDRLLEVLTPAKRGKATKFVSRDVQCCYFTARLHSTFEHYPSLPSKICYPREFIRLSRLPCPPPPLRPAHPCFVLDAPLPPPQAKSNPPTRVRRFPRGRQWQQHPLQRAHLRGKIRQTIYVRCDNGRCGQQGAPRRRGG